MSFRIAFLSTPVRPFCPQSLKFSRLRIPATIHTEEKISTGCYSHPAHKNILATDIPSQMCININGVSLFVHLLTINHAGFKHPCLQRKNDP
jgi:hypothetical protein